MDEKSRNYNQTTIERIGSIIQEKDISMAEFARNIGISRGTVSAWFRNTDIAIKSDTIQKIAEIYDVDAMWLLGADVPQKESKEHEMLRMRIERELLNLSDSQLEKVRTFIDMIKE